MTILAKLGTIILVALLAVYRSPFWLRQPVN